MRICKIAEVEEEETEQESSLLIAHNHRIIFLHTADSIACA
jgi:hypothetical protein